MKRKQSITALAVAIVVIICLTAGGCLSLIDNIVYNFINGFSEDYLPEDTVYGSENPLAVGFRDGRLVAFWDEGTNETYSVTVTGDDDISTEYTMTANGEMFDGCYFDLEAADMTYGDDFSVTLKRISKIDNTYTVTTYNYAGINASVYSTYTKNVPGGFDDIDYYIASRYELFEFYNYLIVFRPSVKRLSDRKGVYWSVEANVYLAYDFQGLYASNVTKDKAYEAEIMCAVASFEDSAGYSYAYSISGNVGNLLLRFAYDADPLYVTDTKDSYVNATTRLERAHYVLGENERSFPVDEIDRTVSVSSSDQLYFALKKGYRPVPVQGSNAEKLYAEMRRILSAINADGYDDYTKIHYIYDYMVDTVLYDYVFVDEVLDDDDAKTDCFSYGCLYLEGVFGLTPDGEFDETARVAICDGLSKAFLCLARIEGIEAIKIAGTVNSSSGDGGAHAWNKVRIAGRWFMVDTTWGNLLKSETGEEFLSHDYLLVRDDSKHVEDQWFSYPAANSRYSFKTF